MHVEGQRCRGIALRQLPDHAADKDQQKKKNADGAEQRGRDKKERNAEHDLGKRNRHGHRLRQILGRAESDDRSFRAFQIEKFTDARNDKNRGQKKSDQK